MKLITSRYPSRCRDCGATVAAGQSIWWERGAKPVCDPCLTSPYPEQADEDTWGVQASINAEIDAEERAKLNDLSRRYGPSGRFNRAIGEQIARENTRAKREGR